jgi:hypothetical protein
MRPIEVPSLFMEAMFLCLSEREERLTWGWGEKMHIVIDRTKYFGSIFYAGCYS